MTIKVYGASDDLIEIEGDINEEFSYSDSPTYLGFSSGVLLQVVYTGTWDIKILNNPDDIAAKVFEATDWESDDYSDIIEIHSHLDTPGEPQWDFVAAEWVVCGTEIARV